MQNFILHTPTKILFGKDQIAEVAGQIPADARILITYGGGSVKKNGVLDQVYSALAGRDVREFSGIEPNPTYETLMKAVEVVKAENIDFLLAAGQRAIHLI
ncbi:iron-containing alcohol dehydrogenase, partial [Serratia marcescens]|uniref:iron-containing alcohol dehydrogenase n=1 Tax=Serratia marcescens TaxID=615 RepID=UPI001BCB95B1